MSPEEIKHMIATMKQHIGMVIMKKDLIWIKAFEEYNAQSKEQLSMRFFKDYKLVLKHFSL